MRELTLFAASMPGILLAQNHLPLVQEAVLELVIGAINAVLTAIL